MTISSSGLSSNPESTMLPRPMVVELVRASCADTRADESAASCLRTRFRRDSSTLVEPIVTASPLLLVEPQTILHRCQRRPRAGAKGPGVEIRESLENGEQRSSLVEGQPTSLSTGA